MADKKVEIDIVAKDKTGKATKQAEKNLTSLGKVAKTVGPLITAAFGALIVKESVQAFIRQEAAIAQLEQRLISTGHAAGFTSVELQDMAASLQEVTTVGDEATIEMQSLLLTFTQIQGPIFARAQESILNVAQAMGTDLKSAAIQVGKALNDPKGQLSALSRSGIQFTADQKDMIKTMQEAGDVAGAQAVILKELEKQFGGAARAARETFGGSLTAAGNSIGDLSELLGEAIIDATGFKQVLQDIPGIISRIDRAINGIGDSGRIKEIGAEINALERNILGLNNLPMMPALREERIQERKDAIRLLSEELTALQTKVASGPESPVTANQRAEKNQETLNVIAAQELAASMSLLDLAAQQHENRNAMLSVQTQNEIDSIIMIEERERESLAIRLAGQQAFVNGMGNLIVGLTSLGLKNNNIVLASAIGTQQIVATAAAYSGASQALADPNISLAGRLGAYAAVLGAGLKAATTIASLAGGGTGGGAGGAPGSGGAAPIAQPQPTEQERGGGGVTVNIDGNVIESGQWVETELIPAINAAQTRGTTIDVRG